MKNSRMDRYLQKAIKSDLADKIVLLMGPRQCGKTTLSKMLVDDFQYLNHDLAEHRLLLKEKSWDREKHLIIFDELHKMDQWKSWIKGIYDVESIPPALLVTGSAKLSVFKKTGDSLAGRHFQYRLHPLDLKEALKYTELNKPEIFKRLLTVGGFPEPFLKAKETFYARWKKSHVDLIIKEDLLSLTNVRDIQSIETMLELLRSRVGSPVSANSLARDLQKSPNTIRNWLQLMEDLYVIFKVSPFHKNIARAILKEPKYYFYDTGMVLGDDGVKLENLVACSLLKEIHRFEDMDGGNAGLHYIRNKDGYEIDFMLSRDNQPEHLLEVKWKTNTPSKNFKKLMKDAEIKRTQIVGELTQAKSYPDGMRIEPAIDFLSNFELTAKE